MMICVQYHGPGLTWYDRCITNIDYFPSAELRASPTQWAGVVPQPPRRQRVFHVTEMVVLQGVRGSCRRGDGLIWRKAEEAIEASVAATKRHVAAPILGTTPGSRDIYHNKRETPISARQFLFPWSRICFLLAFSPPSLLPPIDSSSMPLLLRRRVTKMSASL